MIIRATIRAGEDIGFLPGAEEEMASWLGALIDNSEVLISMEHDGGWAREATADRANKRILRSLNFIRGRIFINHYIIIDEAQNLCVETNENHDRPCWARQQNCLPW